MSVTDVTLQFGAKLSTAEQVNELHRLVEQTYRDGVMKALDYALAAGRLLTAQKESLSHGEWLPWLGEHLDFSPRRAQEYMQLAASPQEVTKARASAHLTIEDALKHIREPKQPGHVDRREMDDLLAGQDFGDEPGTADNPIVVTTADTDRETRRLLRARTLWTEIGEKLDALETGDLSQWAKCEQANSAGVNARYLIAALDDLKLSYQQ